MNWTRSELKKSKEHWKDGRKILWDLSTLELERSWDKDLSDKYM